MDFQKLVVVSTIRNKRATKNITRPIRIIDRDHPPQSKGESDKGGGEGIRGFSASDGQTEETSTELSLPLFGLWP